MNQDQRRALRVPKRVCGGHDTRTNNRSQLCKSWSRWRDVLMPRGKKETERSNDRKRGEKEALRAENSAHTRISPINAFENNGATAQSFDHPPTDSLRIRDTRSRLDRFPRWSVSLHRRRSGIANGKHCYGCVTVPTKKFEIRVSAIGRSMYVYTDRVTAPFARPVFPFVICM